MKTISKKLLLIAMLFVFSFCACVSSNRITYLQDEVPEKYAEENKLIKMVKTQKYVFHIQPHDRLMVNVFSLTDEKLNFLKKPEMELEVDDKGQITIPVVGNIVIKGLTLKEAEEKIQKAVTPYLKSPEVFVKLLNYNITVLGEVFRQGTFTLNESKANILEVLGMAGGMTENANMQKVRIIRNANDTAKIFNVNVLDDKMLASNQYYMQPNDIILVNPIRAKASNQQKLSTVGFIFSIVSSLTLIVLQVF